VLVYYFRSSLFLDSETLETTLGCGAQDLAAGMHFGHLLGFGEVKLGLAKEVIDERQTVENPMERGFRGKFWKDVIILTEEDKLVKSHEPFLVRVQFVDIQGALMEKGQ
jgi:hypothetical protein